MRHRRGFTLIEMLTVIAIIGILAGILVPALLRAKRHAIKARAQADISNLALAFTQYQTDHVQYPNDQNTTGPNKQKKSGEQLKVGLETYKYFTFPEKQLDGNLYIDAFGKRGRDVYWYMFDNNEAEDDVDPAPDPAGREAGGQNWNPTNVNRTKCDIWSAGEDGKDAVTAPYIAGNYAGCVTYKNFGSLAGKDDLANW